MRTHPRPGKAAKVKYKRVVFHHLPKTGGSTVQNAVRMSLGGYARAIVSYKESAREFMDKNYRDTFFTSHHSFDPMTFIPTKREFYFTWLRNPVDMVYSSFFFFRPQAGLMGNLHYDLLDRIHKHETIEEYVDAVLADERPFFPETIFTRYTAVHWAKFNFIGQCKYIPTDVPKLLNMIDAPPLKAPIPTKNKTRNTQPYTYRRQDLATRLSPEIYCVQEVSRG